MLVLKELFTLRLKLAFYGVAGWGFGTSSEFILAMDSSANLMKSSICAPFLLCSGGFLIFIMDFKGVLVLA